MQIDFTPVPPVTLTVNTQPGWAEVTVEPNLSFYEPNSIVTITGQDTAGAVFSHWQVYDPNHPGDANYAAPDDSNNPITIVMNTDREVTAVFDEPNDFMLTVNTQPEWAEVTVEPNLPFYEPNSTVTLTAEETAGAVFSHWQVYDPNHPGDANYAAPDDSNNPITIIMNADREVTAVFDEPNGIVDIETVLVGNPGNTGEWSGESYGGAGPDRICGAVDYYYRIGKFEVTTGQYCEFLNAVADTDTYGLYNAGMWDVSEGCKIQRSGSSGTYTYSVPDANYANRPVNVVSWGDAARFCNWLHNGQPTGMQDPTTTEDGSYNLNGATSDPALLAVTRQADATWVIPSEDEWYKSAYHKNDGASPNYFDYATDSNTLPSNELIDPDPGNNATYWFDSYLEWPNGTTIGSPYWRTEVGAHENSESPYDTFDQTGNVWEWNDTIVNVLNVPLRGLRGGAYNASDANRRQHAAYRGGSYPSDEILWVGFRVALRRTALTVLVDPHPEWGYVTVEPNLPLYQPGATVTLTAILIEPGKLWTGWAGDVEPNDIYTNPLTITMDSNKTITTGFKCGIGMGPFLPMMLGVLGLLAVVRRRR